MREIKLHPENLTQVMYGLLLPAVGGTIFWYLIQHAASGQLLQLSTCVVIVYYFALHFLAGQQVDAKHYGALGFALDLMAIVAVEVLFYAVDGLPERLGLGMVSILVILVTLVLWNFKTARVQRQHRWRNTIVLVASSVLVALIWLTSEVFDVVTEHLGMVVSVVVLALAATIFLLVGSRERSISQG